MRVPNTPKTVHIAPEAPKDDPLIPVAIFDAWLKNDVITHDDRYRPKNCSLPSSDTMGQANECRTNMLHPKWMGDW